MQSRTEELLIRLRAQDGHLARAAEASAYMDAANVAASAKVEAEQKADSTIARVINDEATRKTDRDKRYADRKARQRSFKHTDGAAPIARCYVAV